jgi:uncharacterized membrane protein YdbT with pleckstrin-like domain
MSYLTKILRPDEQVLAEGKLHWIIYYPAIAWLVIGVILLFSYGTAEPSTQHVVRYLVRQPVQIGLGKLHHAGVWLFVLCAYIALLHALIISIRRRTTEIAVTDRRVIYKTGLIATHTAEMNMDKIESVLVDQTMIGRLLNYGTVYFRGTGEGLENLRYISSPISLRNTVLAK